MNRIGNILYRPTENHVGVIYRGGRFNRFVDPDRWAFTFPWLESVLKEIKLDMRTAQVSLKDVFTLEKVAVDVDFKVFYFIDLRQADPTRRLQAIRFSTDTAWDEIVRTAVNDIVRNVVFIGRSFNELNSKDGRVHLKAALSAEVAERVSGFGILINPRFGVNIVDLQPNEEFRKALMEQSAANALGSAAVSRLSPLLDRIMEQKQEKAVVALLMQIASAVAKNGTVPDVIFPNENGNLAGGISQESGRGSMLPNYPPSNRRPKSIAGD